MCGRGVVGDDGQAPTSKHRDLHALQRTAGFNLYKIGTPEDSEEESDTFKCISERLLWQKCEVILRII